MIRLVCFAEVMRKFSASEASALCVSNPNYADLMKVLPWVMPSRSWYECLQAKILSGIPAKVLMQTYEDRERLTYVKINRIRNNKRFPQAEIVAGHARYEDDYYIELLQSFWAVVMSNLQTGVYPVNPDDAPDIYKMWWIARLARKEDFLMKHIFTTIDRCYSEPITVASSLPGLDKIVLFNEYNQYMDRTRSEYLQSIDGYAYRNTSKTVIAAKVEELSEVRQQYLDVYYGRQGEYDMIYDFLYRLNCFGYLNDSLINAEYEIEFY